MEVRIIFPISSRLYHMGNCEKDLLYPLIYFAKSPDGTHRFISLYVPKRKILCMKSIFDQSTRDEIKGRIQSLSENSTAQWGKMNVSQMMRHCTKWDEMALDKVKYKQSFIGRLFGKVALKDMMKDEPKFPVIFQ